MRIKLSNWPFKEDEIVTLHWIASPKIDSEGEKICEVYFRTENGAIKSVPIAWGSLPELRIGQKFTNKKLINDLIHNKEVSISTNRVYKLKYGKAVDIIPRDLYTLKVYSIFGEWCCSFEHNWYTYYVPCVELARIFLARNTTLANQLLSTGGLEDLIDISSWQIDGSEVKFEFRNETPGITDTFAKTFAAIYGTPELHRIWESTYTQYVATGMIQTELPAGTYIKLFFTENEGTKQRFVNSIEFNDITSIFQKVTYGPAKLVHSRKSAEKKGVINTHLPSDDSEIDATGALARRTHFTTETTSSGGSFLDHIEAERLKITDKISSTARLT